MRVVCALLVGMLAASTASAHPRRPDPDTELDSPFDPFGDGRAHRRPPKHLPPPPTPEQLCERNKSWPKLVGCLKKGGNTVTTLYDVTGAKLVAVRGNPSYDTSAVYLYTEKNGTWNRAPIYMATTPTNEILGFSRLKHENGYRIDQGTVMRTTVNNGDRFAPSFLQVVLRRRTSTICLDNGSCQSVFSACDALVDGKSRWSFRGDLTIDHGIVRVAGDKTYAGQICSPAPSQFTNDPDPMDFID